MKRWNAESDGRAVAVVGMGCRLPGASGPEELWRMLCDGTDATSETPAERYDVDAVYSSAGGPGTLAGRRGGYLDGIADFDAEFFGISPAEAVYLDPQQRLLLMVAWESLEDAGLIPSELAGSRTGVYVGNTRADYLDRHFRQGLESVTAGSYHAFRPMLPARLSHALDLRGPSVVLDTACSSSLVAVHTAVQSLRAGETPLALAAGVNLPMRPDEGVMMTQAGALAADGRSKFGSADADGFSPSDGVCVVVLKRLADAVADGDRVRAVIQGSALGNNGSSGQSLLSPSLSGHQDVLRWAYEDAGVDPCEVDFVEAHGSGALSHDATELRALAEVLGEGRPADRPCLVGSVKSNVGHGEAAGGLAGLIKAVLSLEHGTLPASLHHQARNPMVDWDGLPLELAEGNRPLPDRGRPALAGVTGQGVSTLNAHVVLRQGDTVEQRNMPEARLFRRRRGPHPLPLSAATPQALEELRDAYVAHLSAGGAGEHHTTRDICYSAATRRQHHAHRLVVQGRTHRELVEALSAVTVRPEPVGAVRPASAVGRSAETYLRGGDVDWAAAFADDCRFVPLPRYPWQTRRYWLGEEPQGLDGDLAASVLREHGRAPESDYPDTSLLSEIGIDSLARLQIVVSLARDHAYEVEPEEVAELRTVGDFRRWIHVLEEQAA